LKGNIFVLIFIPKKVDALAADVTGF